MSEEFLTINMDDLIEENHDQDVDEDWKMRTMKISMMPNAVKSEDEKWNGLTT